MMPSRPMPDVASSGFRSSTKANFFSMFKYTLTTESPGGRSGNAWRMASFQNWRISFSVIGIGMPPT